MQPGNNQLAELLSTLRPSSMPWPPAFALMADKATTYRAIRPVLAAIQQQRVSRIYFVVDAGSY